MLLSLRGPRRATSFVAALALLVAVLVGAQMQWPARAVAATGPTVVDDGVAAEANRSPLRLPGATDDQPGSAPIRPELTAFPVDQLADLPPGSTISADGRVIEMGNRRAEILPEDGRIFFAYNPGYVGTTTLRYRVTDGDGASDEGLATVVVQAGGVDDQVTTPQNVTLDIDVLANDTAGLDADGSAGSLDPTSVRFPVDGQPSTAVVSSDGRELSIPKVGVFTADPQTGHVAFDPELKFVGSPGAPVFYTAQDTVETAAGAEHHAYAAYIDCIVKRVVPQITSDQTRVVFGTTSVVLAGVLSDQPGDPAVPLRPELTTFERADLFRLPAGSTLSADGRTLNVVGEGRWTFLENWAVEFVPARGFVGTTTQIEYLAYDANLTQGFGLLGVTVQQGPWSRPDTATTAQNVNTVVDVLANDNPGKNARGTTASMDPKSVHFEARLQPKGAKVWAAGRVLAVPNEGVYTAHWGTGLVTFDPYPRFVGTTSPVTYRAQNSTQDSGLVTHYPTHSTLTVSVHAVTPVARNNWISTDADDDVDIPVLDNDSAGAATAPLVRSSVTLRLLPGLPAGTRRSSAGTWLKVPGRGTFTAHSTGVVTFEPEPGFTGRVPTIGYQVLDTNTTAARATITVQVG